MGWMLEVFRMALYISFPVGIFHFVNHPYFYDKYVMKTRQEYYPPENEEAIEEMNNFIREFNANIEKERLENLERQYTSR